MSESAEEDAEDRPIRPSEVPDSPVLRLLEASTVATVEHSARVAAMEKSVDRAARALELLADAEKRGVDEVERANDISSRELALMETMYGERWTRYSEMATKANATITKAIKHPAITLPLGAVSYGIAKLVAQLFGFDVGVLP